MTAGEFPTLLQRFFSDRLLRQVGASPHTVASYRDAFRLLLRFAETRLGRAPSSLRMEDFQAPFLGDFLDYLEEERGNSVRTRNARLSALHAFFRFVALEEPALALLCHRALALPMKRSLRSSVEYLSEEEVEALLATPDAEKWIGRRDRSLLLLAMQTGLRNAELRALRREDVRLGTGAHVRCYGKGRKTRCTPLRPDVTAVMTSWLGELPATAGTPVFPSLRGGCLSPDSLQRLVAKHIGAAAGRCPSLVGRRITPHSLRHTAAMSLLRSGVDRSVIALWLGHESMETTQIYLHADMLLKEQALAHSTPSGLAPGRYHPDDTLLAFLESL